MEDISPVPSAIHRICATIRSHKFSWEQCLGVFVDNAFEAGATEIYITLGRDAVHIQDNGLGCTAADMGKMLTIGYMDATANQAIMLGDKIEIASRRDGAERRIALHWPDIATWDSWRLPAPPTTSTDAPNGTTITVSKLIRHRRVHVGNVINNLGLTYTPAIQAGKKIFVQEEQLALIGCLPV